MPEFVSVRAMNRLGAETSPYLRQHADNPVDWYPWGEEAFAAARADDKPILLSVGYSACHWCHVMAHESFEDPETAKVMNELFVNVKVDREERPDVDTIYMEAVQALTGRGGWPMTVFMTPDGRPFHGGTYYPRESRGQMPSFTEIMHRIQDVWANRRTDVDNQADQLTQSLNRTALIQPDPQRAPADTGSEALSQATAALRQQYDAAWGGFGGAPKFPQTMSQEVLLRSYLHSGDQDVLNMVINSLDAMASGGDLRPLGRRLQPLLGGRPVDCAPLREDAVRRRPVRPAVPARLAGDRPTPLPPGAGRDHRLRAARPAPRQRRLLLGPRRRF